MEMKEYLTQKLGENQGQFVIKDVTENYTALEKLCSEENPANTKTMQTKIFPRIALYQALQKTMSKQQAYDIVWEYTKTYICEPTRQQYTKIEKIPFFFSIFRRLFLHTMLHSSQWTAELTQNTHTCFGFEIHRCLWKDTCQTCGCPELCQVFCDSDWETFGSMHKINFSRTQTLGTGGTICDFTFQAKPEREHPSR